MLSYQHAYHAGNLADLHKHAALAWMLDYMAARPKPLSYFETHAGRGLYDLAGPEAAKTGEAEAGIGRAGDWFGEAHPLARALASVRARHTESAYPGSPLIAAALLRESDRMHLAELHPQEYAALRSALGPRAGAAERREGFEMARARIPPDPARGLLLVDTSDDLKSDYETLPGRIRALHKRWPVGVIVLWYPILTAAPHLPMLDALSSALPQALRHEVRFTPIRPGHRMEGSGLFVLNPPYGLDGELARLSALFAKL